MLDSMLLFYVFSAANPVKHKIEFVEGNAECLPFADHSFDAYTIAFGLRNVTNIDNALRDAHRVLKKGLVLGFWT